MCVHGGGPYGDEINYQRGASTMRPQYCHIMVCKSQTLIRRSKAIGEEDMIIMVDFISGNLVCFLLCG